MASAKPILRAVEPFSHNGHGLEAVLATLRAGQSFLISAHARPDGDAIGSMLALAMMLEQMGKQVSMVSCDGLPLIYHGLPNARRIARCTEVQGKYDAVILLECDGIERSKLMGVEDSFLVNIDHHLSGVPFASVNWIDPKACAVAEMIYRLAQAAKINITREIATCLYVAVLTDTGSFCYESTDAETFILAADLVRHGASPRAIAEQVYFCNPISKMSLLGAALSTLRRDGRMAWLWVTQNDMLRTQAAEEDCEGVVNYAIGIAGIEAAVFLRELSNRHVRLSLRSKGRINVARMAEELGGGGHKNAAGCTVEGPLSAATTMVLPKLRAALEDKRI